MKPQAHTPNTLSSWSIKTIFRRVGPNSSPWILCSLGLVGDRCSQCSLRPKSWAHCCDTVGPSLLPQSGLAPQNRLPARAVFGRTGPEQWGLLVPEVYAPSSPSPNKNTVPNMNTTVFPAKPDSASTSPCPHLLLRAGFAHWWGSCHRKHCLKAVPQQHHRAWDPTITHPTFVGGGMFSRGQLESVPRAAEDIPRGWERT